MDQAIYQLTVKEVGNGVDGQPQIHLYSPSIDIVITGNRNPAVEALCRSFAAHLGDDASVFFKFAPAAVVREIENG